MSSTTLTAAEEELIAKIDALGSERRPLILGFHDSTREEREQAETNMKAYMLAHHSNVTGSWYEAPMIKAGDGTDNNSGDDTIPLSYFCSSLPPESAVLRGTIPSSDPIPCSNGPLLMSVDHNTLAHCTRILQGRGDKHPPRLITYNRPTADSLGSVLIQQLVDKPAGTAKK